MRIFQSTFQLVQRAFILFGAMVAFQAQAFEAGVDYLELKNSIVDEAPVASLRAEFPDQVQVIQFFSYGCHWCYNLENKVTSWTAQLPKEVAFVREPVVFQPGWRPLAKAYHTAVGLGVWTEALHTKLYAAAQGGKGALNSDKKVRSFFADQAISSEAFGKVYDSFSVNMQLERTNALMRAFEIMYIPLFIVNGPQAIYSVSVDSAGGQDRLFEVLDFLIDKVKQEQMHTAATVVNTDDASAVNGD